MRTITKSLWDIAKICHEANRAYCETIGDLSQKPWADAPEWQRLSASHGVEYLLNNFDAPASALHEAWLQYKLKDGWKYGPIKDETKKEHPCCVPYEQLPREQQIKDSLFRAVVSTFL